MEKVVPSNATARTMLSALRLMESVSARQVLLVTNARTTVQQEPMDKIVHNVAIVKMEENAILRRVNAPAKLVGVGLIARDLVEKTRLAKNAETNAIV